MLYFSMTNNIRAHGPKNQFALFSPDRLLCYIPWVIPVNICRRMASVGLQNHKASRSRSRDRLEPLSMNWTSVVFKTGRIILSSVSLGMKEASHESICPNLRSRLLHRAHVRKWVYTCANVSSKIENTVDSSISGGSGQ